jgi:hypothetical protein
VWSGMRIFQLFSVATLFLAMYDVQAESNKIPFFKAFFKQGDIELLQEIKQSYSIASDGTLIDSLLVLYMVLEKKQ